MVEPIAAKQLVPLFGGSAAVWITCLVFFQTALLAGYLYAHWLGRSPTGSPQSSRRLWLHLGLLLLAAVCVVAWAGGRGGTGRTSAGLAGHPVLIIFANLSLSIGLPFLLLASTGPLLQVWLTSRAQGEMPYRLFALSNLASLLALALYPAVIEPHLTLHHQRIAWCVGFIGFVGLSSALLRRVSAFPPSHVERNATANIPGVSVAGKLLWLLLPMGAGMQLSAVTSHLTENIAAIPLLWILPLAVYLLSPDRCV